MKERKERKKEKEKKGKKWKNVYCDMQNEKKNPYKHQHIHKTTRKKKKSLAHKKSEKNKTETTNLHERTLKTIATEQTKKENRKPRPRLSENDLDLHLKKGERKN